MILAGGSVAVDDAMAWNEHGNGVLGDGRSNGSHGFRLTDPLRDVEISSGASKRHFLYLVPYA